MDILIWATVFIKSKHFSSIHLFKKDNYFSYMFFIVREKRLERWVFRVLFREFKHIKDGY